MKILVAPVLALASFVVLPLASAQDLIPGKGKDKVEAICGACHGLEGVMAMNNTKSAWEDLIDDMRGRGADGSEDDFKAVATYLAKYYGPIVQVNKATAKEFTDQLDITPEEGAAIVKYRDSKGSIKDWDDLSKTPGLTASKVEPLKKRLKF
jgi:mono/diheme cytochrome c family protein